MTENKTINKIDREVGEMNVMLKHVLGLVEKVDSRLSILERDRERAYWIRRLSILLLTSGLIACVGTAISHLAKAYGG